MKKMEKLKKNITDYQLNAGKTYMNYESDEYSQYQNYLYKRALYGLDALSQDELAATCSKKKQRIINVYKRAQSVLNIEKQKATINYTNVIFKSLFPNSKLTESLIENSEIDEKFKNDPLSAVASTFFVHNNIKPFISCLKRQGDVMLAELSEEITPEGEMSPLTKEEYFGFLVAES